MPVDIKDAGFNFKETFKKATGTATPETKVKKGSEEIDFKSTFQESLKKKASTPDASAPSNTSSTDVSTDNTEDKDNSFYDQLMSFYKKGQQEKDNKETKQSQSILNLENRITPQSKVTAPSGVNIDIDDSKLPAPLVNAVPEIQKRINEGTQTPDDIHIIAQASDKTPEAVIEYLQGNTNKGLAIDNAESIKALQGQMTNAIVKYNESTGSQLLPEEVLSSSEKMQDFIQKIQQAKSKFITSKKDNLSQRALNTEGYVPTSEPVYDNYDLSQEQFVENANEYKNLLIDQATYSKILENEKSGVPKEQTIKDIARIINPKEYYRSIKAQIPNTATANPITNTGRMYDMIFGTDEVDELLSTPMGVAEMNYNNQQQRIANNEISQGILTEDENLFNAGKARMNATQNTEEIYLKYPILLKQKIAQEVSKELAYKAGQLEGSETQDYSLKIFGSSVYDIAKTDAFNKYLNDPKTRDIAESMLDRPDLFADASYLGGVWDSFKQPFEELGLSVLDITGARTNRAIFADKLKDELFPKEVEGTKADFTTSDIGNLFLMAINRPAVLMGGHPFKVRTALNTTANLTGMLAIAAATEGVAGGLGATARVSKSLGAYTSFGLPSYDAALKDSYNFLDNDAARTLYATITAITNAEGGRFLDLGKAVRIPGVSENYAKLAQGLSKGDISKKAVNELLGETEKKYVDFAVKYGKNVSKGAATMAYFGITNSINKIAFGDPNTKAEDILPQAAHSFMDGVLGMSIMGGFGAVGEMRAEKNTTYKGFIYNMALNRDATKDAFEIGLRNGTYTPEQYNEKVQILNTAVSAKNALDAAQAETNTTLDQNQKSVYVANKTAEAVLREKAKSKGVSDADAMKYEEQADRLRLQSTQTLDGLKFTPTLEPLYDLYHAEKEYDAALSNFNEQKGSEKELEVAKEKYDNLVNRYFTEKGLQDLAAEKLNPKPQVSEEGDKAIEEGVKSGAIPEMEAKMLNTVENKIQFLKEIAQQSKGELADGTKAGEGGEQSKATRAKYGNEIVDAALRMFTMEHQEVKDVADAKIKETAAEAAPFIPKEQADKVQTVFDRVNKAEEINEKELSETENTLYDVLDKHPNAAHLIEPLISKIQDYEFATKTETGTVTKEVATETVRPARKREAVTQNLDQWEGSRATITDAGEKEVSGILRVENGKYSLFNEQGEKVASLGEKSITDRDITLPFKEDVPIPIQMDADGNVKSITLQLNKVDKENGGIVPDKQITVEFKDPEKALDYAIALRAEQIGEINPQKFDVAYEQVQSEVSKEVPKKDISSQTKTENDGNKSSSQESSQESGEKGSKESGSESSRQKDDVKEEGEPASNSGSGEPSESGGGKPPVETAETKLNPESDATVLSFKGLQEIADEFDLTPVTSRERKTDVKLFQDAKDKITEWVKKGTYKKNVEKLVKSAENMEVLNDEQRVIVQQHMANVRNSAKEAKAEFGVNSKEYDAALLELKRVTKAGLLTRQAAGAALRIGGNGSLVRYDVPDMMAAKMEALNVDKLTDAQKAEVDKQSQDIEKKTLSADEKVAMYEAQIAQYKAEKELKNSKAKTGVSKKTENDYKAERQTLKDKLKQQVSDFKEAGQKLGIAADGGAESFVISAQMAKTISQIVKSHVEEIGDKLEEVTKRVLDEVKDIFPTVTQKDIHDIIAGKYNEKGKTRSQLQVDLQSLQVEAKLINKLEELENGSVPKNEKQKVERNQNIKDLRDAIKVSEVNQLNKIKERNEAAAAKIKEKLQKGEFDKEPKSEFLENEEMRKRFPKQYREAMDAIVAKDNAKHEFEIGLLKDARSKRDFGSKYIYDPAKDVIGTVKALRTGIDFSALFIQNIVPILSNPSLGAKAIAASFRDFSSNAKFERALAELHNSKYWDLIQKSGLDITEPKSVEARNKEEIFNRNLLEKDITIGGKKYNIGKYLTSPFERAFVSLGNHIRTIAFLTMAEKLKEDGLTFENNPKEFKDLAKLLNTQTGRGVLPDFINKSTETVNTVIWSPRLMASRLNLLGLGDIANPLFAGRKGFYAGLTPRMRKKAALDMVKFIGTVLAVYGAAGLITGAKPDLNPQSSTFGDLQDEDSDKSYNMFGNFAPYVKLAAIMATGQRKLGEKMDDVSDSKGKTRLDILTKFLRGKVTPVAGAILNTVEGKDYLGNKTDALTEFKNMVTPMSLSGIPKDLQRDGLVPAFVNGLISVTGISVKDKRDFEKKEDISYSKEELKDPTFKYFSDKKVELPETHAGSIKIEDNKTNTIKTLTDYGEEKVKKFDDLRKKYLKEELANLKEKNYAYVDKFGRAAFTSAKGGKQVPLDDLTADQLGDLVSKLSTKATRKTKEQLFPN